MIKSDDFNDLKNTPEQGIEFGKRSRRGRGVAQGDFGLVLAPPKPVKGTRKRGYDAPERRGGEKIC